ncbi:hypothetical protein Tsubulata_036159 [Turnera subulata]|uniref:Uncharacterized protein n=1 Tax=Turnera subulata TaxID=218843 RepID=A0A9Q0J238_9ROSI|nr:hypothetical protein Tsubulata_036159 [Turnera subulata]
MVNHGGLLFTCILLYCLSISISSTSSSMDNDIARKVHIVYMGPVPGGNSSPSFHHLNILTRVVTTSSAEAFLIRSYGRSFHGFAANLTSNEAQELASMDEVVSVFPSTTLKLQTTRSWDFMGFHETVTRKAEAESDVIIGVIDTGIWPESPSFQEQEGLSPPPKKWKGVCAGGKNFTCNRKIIGARYYTSSASAVNMTARDEIGHGSHAASIAAGNEVNGASFYGLAQGTARGAVPSARIAVYKVCDPDTGCDSADILAAFDDAIADGVDIITISIGSDGPVSLDQDVISIGSFHGMQQGIVTVQSAGNGVCGEGTVTSVAPWVLTVGASSIDRKFVDRIVLGNGITLIGNSINSFTLNGTMFPLVYGKDVSPHCSETDSRSCKKGCTDSSLVKGKIVLCDLFEGTVEAYNAGALGAIVLNTLPNDVSFVVPLPSSALDIPDHSLVQEYVKSTKNPQVKILKSEANKDYTAPTVASFSTCGPNIFIPEIMKPEVTAPGVNILAAYSPVASPSDYPLDKRQTMYSIVSGTSMSCPHVAGVAAYVKSFHPDWSPSAIKSAIMTTAWPMNNSANPLAEFSYGSGHINPVKAIAPGLVYEADKEDYIKLLCGLGLDSYSLGHITRDGSRCGNSSEYRTFPANFNYPSITFRVSPAEPFSFKFRRTVTNVGYSNSIYRARVLPHASLTIQVRPQILSFKSLHEKKSFVVTTKGKGIHYEGKTVSASLVWSDGLHEVRTPIIAVKANLTLPNQTTEFH